MKKIAAYILPGMACLCISAKLMASADPVPLRNGMVITHSVTIKKGVYKINGSRTGEKSVIRISGNHIVVDFSGSTLQGSLDKTRPDEFYGIALQISAGSDVTIKNAIIKGYKIAVKGNGITGGTIENCDLSYNFRQHLNSNRQREDLSDWQSYHNNEKDQWMRFGAAIYLRDCDSMTIRNDLITGGQCGLMMTNCNHGSIYNNNFSFNSGIGIGMYRSSYNRIMNNKVDWNVRGVSEGFYYRGQDAAAILVYEQSSHNIFAYNSATHSGDGFFLWAGNSTLQTGEGGCNDNLIYGNDFSFAPTNGVETTFSSNRVIANKIEGCDNGIWAGYSYQSVTAGNLIKDNNTGIAIEQGQDNRIEGNSFSGGRTAIQLWATPGRKMEGQYDAKRDVRSMNYTIRNNSFDSVHTAVSINHSEQINLQHNRIRNTTDAIQLDSSVQRILMRDNGLNTPFRDSLAGRDQAPEKIAGARDAMLSPDQPQGRKYMMMTPWGPYDFRSPILWWTRTDASGTMYFDIEGPAGSWKVKSAEGVEGLSAQGGSVPGSLTFHKKEGQSVAVELEYTGGEITSPAGKKYAAGIPYAFGYQQLDLAQSWKMQLYAFDRTTHPVKQPAAFEKMVRTTTPLKETTVTGLNNNYWDTRRDKLPTSRTATCATATIDFPKGSYVIGVSGGDIVRVYVDNKMVINAWDPSKLRNDADYHHDVTLSLKGQHTIRVEQAQFGSYGILYMNILPAAAYEIR
jgi:parallel beta-helix repeat protein